MPALLQVMADPKASQYARDAATSEIKDLAYQAMLKGGLGTNGSEVLPLLLQNLKNNDEWVAGEAAAVLGILKLSPHASVPALMNALQDPRPLVRMRAASALGKFNDDALPALPMLIHALGDNDIEVRECATNSILKIAPDALSAHATSPPAH